MELLLVFSRSKLKKICPGDVRNLVEQELLEDSKKPTMSRENYIIFLAIILVYGGFSAGYLFISLFLIQVKGAPFTSVGIIYLATGAIDILVQVVGGRLSDYLGTKTVTLIGLVGAVVLYLLLTSFVLYNSPVIAYLIVFPALGLFNGLIQLAISSYISDRTKDQMASGMAMLYVGLNLGFTLGPITGGYLVQFYGYYSLFLFGTVTTIASLIVAFFGIKSNPKFALRENPDATSGKKRKKLKKGVIPMLGMVFVSWFVIAYQAVPLSVFESNFLTLSSFEIGIVLSTNGMLITLLQSLISRVTRVEKGARLYTIALGSFIMAMGYVIVLIARSFLLVELAITVTTLGEMMVAVPTQVIVTMYSEEHNRGRYQGLYFASSRAGASISAYVGLMMFAVYSLQAVKGWYLVIALGLAASVAYAVLSPVVEKNFAVERVEESVIS